MEAEHGTAAVAVETSPEESSDGFPVVTPADAGWTDAPVGTRKVTANTPRTPESEATAARWAPTLALHLRPAARHRSRGRSEARPAARRTSTRSSNASRDGPGDSDPEQPSPLAGPSPRFSRPWRPDTEALVAAAFSRQLTIEEELTA